MFITIDYFPIVIFSIMYKKNLMSNSIILLINNFAIIIIYLYFIAFNYDLLKLLRQSN